MDPNGINLRSIPSRNNGKHRKLLEHDLTHLQSEWLIECPKTLIENKTWNHHHLWSLAPHQGYLLGIPLHATRYARRHRPLLKIALTCHSLRAGDFDPNWRGCRCKFPNLRLQKQWGKTVNDRTSRLGFWQTKKRLDWLKKFSAVEWKLLTFTIWQYRMIFSHCFGVAGVATTTTTTSSQHTAAQKTNSWHGKSRWWMMLSKHKMISKW